MPRPPVTERPESTRDVSVTIIRVLDDQGNAVVSCALDLSVDDLQAGLRHMMTLRSCDARILISQRQGKTSFYIQYLVEEADSCAFQGSLRKGDINITTYRQAGLLIAGGYSIANMMCQVCSNDGDSSPVRQLSVFYSLKEHGFSRSRTGVTDAGQHRRPHGPPHIPRAPPGHRMSLSEKRLAPPKRPPV